MKFVDNRKSNQALNVGDLVIMGDGRKLLIVQRKYVADFTFEPINLETGEALAGIRTLTLLHDKLFSEGFKEIIPANRVSFSIE